MAFGGSFKADHPYATGLLLIVVAGFGIAGSVTGQLAAMLAALWVPDALEVNQAYGGSGGNPTGATGQIIQGLTGGLLASNPTSPAAPATPAPSSNTGGVQGPQFGSVPGIIAQVGTGVSA